MFILYDIIFILVFLFWYLPEYLFKGKFHPGFWMRLGIFPRQIRRRLSGQRAVVGLPIAQATGQRAVVGLPIAQATGGKNIWLHAVSVGEVMAIQKLLAGLRKEYPGRQMVISTVTPTGNAVARKIAAEQDIVIYLPLDISFIVRGAARIINPSLLIVAETELWPNLIGVLNKRGVPVIIVNARISDGSFRGYGLIRFLIRPVLNKISLFCLQTEGDAQRLTALGASPEKLLVTGNMKFDNADYTDKKADYADCRARLGLQEEDKLLIAGSTHPGEEEIILRVYKELLKDFPGLKLLIAPRHPARAREIKGVVRECGFMSERISQLNSQTPKLLNSKTIFILDTIGQLTSFYAVSDIVFVGKSLVNKGGQNILEPAFFAKPILFGPHMSNFREITGLFLANQAAIMVKDENELLQKVRFFLANPLEAERLGRAGKELLSRNQGATERNLEAIKKGVRSIFYKR